MLKVIFTSLMVLFVFIGIGETRTAKLLPPVQTENVQTENVQTENQHVLKHKHNADCEKTTAEPVQIICILDRSGSMASLAEDTIGGYNSFLAKQKAESGAAQVTTVLFDNQYEIITDAVNLENVPDLTSKEYYARGTTALNDATGMTITETLGKMEVEGICPEKRRVLIMIMTDGLENASQEYNKATVKALIQETTKKYNWNYIFLGANIDSISEASSIGINPRHAANYAFDGDGIGASFNMMSRAAEDVRSKGRVDEDWSE